FFEAEDGRRDMHVTGVQTCALPISSSSWRNCRRGSKPSTVGSTGREKYRVSGESTPEPIRWAKRSVVVTTSGRRRAKPRTLASRSEERRGGEARRSAARGAGERLYE